MAVDYFLKIKDYEGESQKDKHENEIDLLTWGWSETNKGSSASGGGGGGSGKVIVNDFTFSMEVNKASPKLLLACAVGTHIPEALLTCRKAGKQQQEYLKIKFTDLLVSYFKTGGSSGQEIPVDEVNLNFAKIEYEYYPQKKDGTLGAKTPVWFDVKKVTGG